MSKPPQKYHKNRSTVDHECTKWTYIYCNIVSIFLRTDWKIKWKYLFLKIQKQRRVVDPTDPLFSQLLPPPRKQHLCV